MPNIGQRRKCYGDNRPHVKNYFTPPSKSRRCNRVTSPRMVLRDKTNDNTSANVGNMKQWLEGMVEELGNEAAASVIASAFMDQLKTQGASLELLALIAMAVDKSLTEDLRKLEEDQDGNVPLDEDEEYDEVEPEFAADTAPLKARVPAPVANCELSTMIPSITYNGSELKVKDEIPRNLTDIPPPGAPELA